MQIELSITPDNFVVHNHKSIAQRRVMCVGQAQLELALVHIAMLLVMSRWAGPILYISALLLLRAVEGGHT